MKKKLYSKIYIKNFSNRFLLISFLSSILLILIIWQWHSFFRENSKIIPDYGGIFTEEVIGDLKNINPLSENISNVDKKLQKLLYASLVEYNPITGIIEPSLANFKISEDKLTYDFDIRDSAKFNNGDLVTTDDVIFTFQTIIQNPNFWNDKLKDKFEYVELKYIDERNIKFVLAEPNSFFLSFLTIPILHKNSFKNAFIEEITDPNHPGNHKIVGAGPYKIKNIIPDDNGMIRIFLEKNKYYFRGKPFISQAVFYVYPTFNHLQINHTWPTIFSLLPYDIKPDFFKNLYEEYVNRQYILPKYLGLFFNLDDDLTKNPKLRSGLSWNIDKEKFLQYNLGWKEIDSFFFFDGVEGWQENNFTEAKKILNDASFRINKDINLREYKNEPVSLVITTSINPPVYSRIAQSIANDWKENLRIDTTVEVLEESDFQEVLKNKDYQILLFGQDFSQNLDTLSPWYSSEIKKLNLSQLTNEKIDEIINEIRIFGQKSDLFRLNQILSDIIPAIPLSTPVYNLLVSNDLKGFSENFGKIRSHEDIFFGIHNWHFKEKSAWDLPRNSNIIWEFIKFLFSS